MADTTSESSDEARIPLRAEVLRRPIREQDNRTRTYRVQLKTIDLAKPTDEQRIFQITFRELNAPLIRLTTTRTGYYAVTDDVTSINKLTSKKATTAFEKINLTPIIPSDLRAKRTVFLRQIGADIGLNPTEEIKNEIKRQNGWQIVTEVIKIKNYAHSLKLVTTDTTTAERRILHVTYKNYTKTMNYAGSSPIPKTPTMEWFADELDKDKDNDQGLKLFTQNLKHQPELFPGDTDHPPSHTLYQTLTKLTSSPRSLIGLSKFSSTQDSSPYSLPSPSLRPCSCTGG
ncbi:hypothetical protein FHG87_000118 [Trinorchestia longiramus]|nr:hypothetical protein FHG87_000118 [Trinorchestia longiramus]